MFIVTLAQMESHQYDRAPLLRTPILEHCKCFHKYIDLSKAYM